MWPDHLVYKLYIVLSLFVHLQLESGPYLYSVSLGFIYSLTPLLQADEVNLYIQMADVAANKDSKYLAEIFVKSSSIESAKCMVARCKIPDTAPKTPGRQWTE